MGGVKKIMDIKIKGKDNRELTINNVKRIDEIYDDITHFKYIQAYQYNGNCVANENLLDVASIKIINNDYPEI